MIDKIVHANDINPRSVFINGLSAGGAMTSVMLACYPELFAAGAIIAGLPFGAAGNVQQAFASMYQCPPRPSKVWGDLVRAAAPGHRGPWPRVSVWHGDADTTVIPSDAAEILKQWTNVHDLTAKPSSETTVDDHLRRLWLNQDGDELVESYIITGMAHGTPLATGQADFECGVAGPFLLDVGISSSFHIARFFGLTADALHQTLQLDAAGPTEVATPKIIKTDQPMLYGEIIGENQKSPKQPPLSRIDIGTVITKALRSAGLMN
jgi:feruloyl esterase